MNLRDKQIHDEGFVEVVSPELARRQLNMSIGLLGAITVAIAAVAATTGLPIGPSNEASIATLTVQQPQFVRPMTASSAGPARVSSTGG